MEVGHWSAVYTVLQRSPGRIQTGSTERTHCRHSGLFHTCCDFTLNCIFFFCGACWKMWTQHWHVLRPRPSRSRISTVFSVFWMDGNQNPLPIFFKIWKWATTVKGRRWFPCTCVNACILPCFWHQLDGGLGRKRYKRNSVESADRLTFCWGH